MIACLKEEFRSGTGRGVEPWVAAGEGTVSEDTGDGPVTGNKGGLWNGRYSETARGAVKLEMTGEGAAGRSATVAVEAWFGAVTEEEVVAGTWTGDGTGAGRGTGTDALGVHETGAGLGIAPLAAAGF